MRERDCRLKSALYTLFDVTYERTPDHSLSLAPNFSRLHVGSFCMSQGHSIGTAEMLQFSRSGGSPRKTYTRAIVLLHSASDDVRFSENRCIVAREVQLAHVHALGQSPREFGRSEIANLVRGEVECGHTRLGESRSEPTTR